MSDLYSGYKEIQVPDSTIDQIHSEKEIVIQDQDRRYTYYPNMYVELRSIESPKHTCLCRVSRDGDFLIKLQPREILGLKSRNREQAFVMDALMDDEIPLVIIAGKAGSGKTLLSLAAAMAKLDTKKYQKVILTRPMSQVGKYQLGALPGGLEEKFSPYLLNYKTNLEQLVGERTLEEILDQMKFEIIPLQLIRGASFNKCFIIADEVQILDHHEMLTIGTRIGEDSKLIVCGDLDQRDEKIAKDKTGLFKLMNDTKIKSSSLTAAVELVKCERSSLAALFANVFE